MSRILLVEDNELNRDLISRYLAFFEHEVEIACDGAAGLEAARTGVDHLDVVLLDMSLPIMDGWKVARELKADEATKALPVIAITAHVMVGDRERALEAGCDDFVAKPIDFNVLMKKIDELSNKATLT